ncbi:MAG: T9SS type A sorting domain-containing protein, partial [candidate division KSB1 bacterium]|nr:T9SS type A sorting domain-containing protein [candidate division KSB1 bacterium]
ISILYVQDQPVYFAGTSVGLFSTTKLDGMSTVWEQEAAEVIGNVVVDMIDVRQSDGFIAVGTHGNGVYSTYLTELPSAVAGRARQPQHFALLPANPNPFRGSTCLTFTLSRAGQVRVQVVNPLGQLVATLCDQPLQPGAHRLQWAPQGLAAGVYLVRVQSEGLTAQQKVLLLE